MKKNASARSRARAPLDSAKRSHRVYFSYVIHNSSIFYPNNLKFCEKLLLTYMINFHTGSFLYVKLLHILFVGKVRKTRTTAGYNWLLNIYKKSTIQSVQRILPAWMVLLTCRKGEPAERSASRPKRGWCAWNGERDNELIYNATISLSFISQ